jgi:hypothetical protein
VRFTNSTRIRKFDNDKVFFVEQAATSLRPIRAVASEPEIISRFRAQYPALYIR